MESTYEVDVGDLARGDLSCRSHPVADVPGDLGDLSDVGDFERVAPAIGMAPAWSFVYLNLFVISQTEKPNFPISLAFLRTVFLAFGRRTSQVDRGNSLC